eukprot:GHVP01024826.1.p1 GENE.GHVP01024826.1~~GHVP01024826.1.p1  ORF type:complete len:266 (+),score=39.43 GHVP01024826.1:524-1321(+)
MDEKLLFHLGKIFPLELEAAAFHVESKIENTSVQPIPEKSDTSSFKPSWAMVSVAGILLLSIGLGGVGLYKFYNVEEAAEEKCELKSKNQSSTPEVSSQKKKSVVQDDSNECNGLMVKAVCSTDSATDSLLPNSKSENSKNSTAPSPLEIAHVQWMKDRMKIKPGMSILKSSTSCGRKEKKGLHWLGGMLEKPVSHVQDFDKEEKPNVIPPKVHVEKKKRIDYEAKKEILTKTINANKRLHNLQKKMSELQNKVQMFQPKSPRLV